MGYGALKGGYTFSFPTGQIFYQKLLYDIVAMIVLKRFHIVTHYCAASFSVKSLKTRQESYPQGQSLRRNGPLKIENFVQFGAFYFKN